MIFVCYRHVKEHLKEVVDKPKEQMTEEELEFHYFKLHDYDNNNKLDGVEIVKAITHFHAGKFFSVYNNQTVINYIYIMIIKICFTALDNKSSS